ncbi:hypothetical protein A0H81_06853 [Grifola frondosa]|uniref:Uncharacterized protein n=1 Tax=Grifola frondosa TaxID=5627 RepID=A0A1C7M9H2_GRIFR|nr:hypothetical protein A0H81_06853 [Grifola frondosa]
MFPTLVRLSKASRRALTPKRGNKDFYKGCRNLSTGPFPSATDILCDRNPTGLSSRWSSYRCSWKACNSGKAKYRLVDEQVRFFVAPSIQDIQSSSLKPYVSTSVRLTDAQKKEVYGKLPRGGLTGAHYFEIAPRMPAESPSQ